MQATDLNNLTFPKVKKFYGNDREDQVLVEHFDLPSTGVFVDIGAGPDGIQGSNSYYFELDGWRVICADADPRNWEALKKNRSEVFCGAITPKSGEVLVNMGDSPDISGVRETTANRGKQVSVPSKRLEELLDEKGVTNIDIISIDTEGSEQDVWESMNPDRFRPRIALIEFLTQGVVNEKLPEFMNQYGYSLAGSVGANHIFTYDRTN